MGITIDHLNERIDHHNKTISANDQGIQRLSGMIQQMQAQIISSQGTVQELTQLRDSLQAADKQASENPPSVAMTLIGGVGPSNIDNPVAGIQLPEGVVLPEVKPQLKKRAGKAS